jgi:predicted AAA+ superfamily ATPase
LNDIYITGSNAFLLSSDLATLFTGRTIEIKITPFSYREYMNYFNLENTIESFDKYVLEGGLAGSYLYPTDKGKYGYITNVYETIIERDLVKRKK